MLKTIRVSALLLALAGAAHAGEILTPPAPEPVETSAVQESSATEESTTETTDALTQIVFIVVESLLP